MLENKINMYYTKSLSLSQKSENLKNKQIRIFVYGNIAFILFYLANIELSLTTVKI